MKYDINRRTLFVSFHYACYKFNFKNIDVVWKRICIMIYPIKIPENIECNFEYVHQEYEIGSIQDINIHNLS